MTVDLSALPPPDAVEPLDYEEILAQMLADFRGRFPQFSAWVESDPALKLLEVVAYREHLLRARVNAAATSVMLPHAAGGDLDNLAALFAVQRLPDESDDALRQRVINSLGAHSTAGSEAGYVYHAVSVPGIAHACARRSDPGTVRVVILGEVEGEGAAANAGLPTQAEQAAVIAALADDDVRPITDTVEVRSATIPTYRVAARLHFDPQADAAAVRHAADAAVRRYCISRHRCGPRNAVRRSGLIAALSVAGVESVELTMPAADVLHGPDTAPWPSTQGTRVGTVGPLAADPAPMPMDGVAIR